MIAAELRQRAVGYGDQHNLAERDCLVDGARLRQRSKAHHQFFQFLGVARRKQDLMPVLDPQPADRAADMAGADGSDWNLAVAIALGAQRCGGECRANEKRAAAGEHCPAIERNSVVPSNDLMNAAARKYRHCSGDVHEHALHGRYASRAAGSKSKK